MSFIAVLETSKMEKNLCYIMSCHVMSCHVMLCYVNSNGYLHFERFENFHIKLNSNGNANHILIFCEHYSNCLQNLIEV
jgi:hypothetical protein